MKRFLRRLYLAAITGAIVTLAAAQRLARPRSHPYRPHDVRRILVLRLGLLGDGTALLTPALRVLRESFPDAEVHVIATPLQRPLLEPLPFVDQVLTWSAGDLLEPRQAVRPGAWRAAFAAVRELRRQRYDLAVSCYGGLASAIALLSGARHRFGYAGEGLPATLSHTLPGRRYDRPWHEADYSVALAQAAAAGREPLALDIGGPAGFGPPLDLVVTPDARAAAAALLEAPLRPTIGPRPISTTGTRHMVALHPGATNGLAKRWPVAYWADVASRLV
ncbi:MAG: glycosyltransferase family 9 protein, partial [Chloroflexota bacterium]